MVAITLPVAAGAAAGAAGAGVACANKVFENKLQANNTATIKIGFFMFCFVNLNIQVLINGLYSEKFFVK
jgi:hypothetical protein